MWISQSLDYSKDHRTRNKNTFVRMNLICMLKSTSFLSITNEILSSTRIPWKDKNKWNSLAEVFYAFFKSKIEDYMLDLAK